MSTPTDSDPNLLTVIAVARAKPGKERALRDALTALIEPTQFDEGVVTYNVHESVDEPGVFCFYENWRSAEALDAHMETAHVRGMFSKLMADDLLDGEFPVYRVRRIG